VGGLGPRGGSGAAWAGASHRRVGAPRLQRTPPGSAGSHATPVPCRWGSWRGAATLSLQTLVHQIIRYVVLNLDLKYSQHPTTGNPSPPAPPSHRDRDCRPAPRRPRTRPGPGPEACRQSCSWGPAVTLRLPGKSYITYPARLTWALHGGLWGVAHTDCTPPTRRRAGETKASPMHASCVCRVSRPRTEVVARQITYHLPGKTLRALPWGLTGHRAG
jgi:hypothetical protein